MTIINREIVEQIADKYKVSPRVLTAVAELIHETKIADLETEKNHNYEKFIEALNTTLDGMGKLNN